MAFKSHKLLMLLAALLLIAVVATEAARTLDDSAKAGEGETEGQLGFLRNLRTYGKYYYDKYANVDVKTYCKTHYYYSFCKAKGYGNAYVDDYKGAHATAYSSVVASGGSKGYSYVNSVAKKGRR